jgi:hypothetical protein
VAATASSEFSSTYDIGNTIDQSGLSVGFTSGVTDFDAYLAGNPTHTLIADNNEWFSTEGVTSNVVTYDLGGTVTIDRLALWNEEFSGMGFFDVFVSIDGLTFTLVANDIMPVDSPGNSDYGAQVFGLGTQTTRFVRFEMGGCPQPDGSPRALCGIGEVAFATATTGAVPEPSVVVLLAAGLLGVAARARRQTRA